MYVSSVIETVDVALFSSISRKFFANRSSLVQAHLGTPLRSTTSLLSALDGRNKKEPATLLKLLVPPRAKVQRLLILLRVVISPQNTHRHRMQGGMPASADEARLLGER